MKKTFCIVLSIFAASNVWASDRVEGSAGISKYNGEERTMIFHAYEGHGGMSYVVGSLFIDFDVSCIDVEGGNAWLAGQVRATNRSENWVQRGNWLFVRVQSGRGSIGWSWVGFDGRRACGLVSSHQGATDTGMMPVLYGDVSIAD